MPERTEQVEDATERAEDGASGAAESVRDALGNSTSRQVLIPAAAAAATLAAGYAANRFGPKLKDALESKVADEGEELAEGSLSKAEDRGGVLGTAAKLMKGASGGNGGNGGMLSGVASKLTPGGEKEKPSQGWGKGRRNPIQLRADVAVPLRTAYDQWTQLEEFPKFMHRVLSVKIDEEDRSKVQWQEKIWFWKRDWEAEIVEMIPDKRIMWRSVSGTSHVGLVTFHPLARDLTRVNVSLDFNPSGMIEKLGSGLRFVKRAAKSDVYRYKAFIEMHEEATGAWRGRIEDGEVVRDPGEKEGRPLEEDDDRLTPGGKAAPKYESDDDEPGDGDEDEPTSRGRDDDELAERRAERKQNRQQRKRQSG